MIKRTYIAAAALVLAAGTAYGQDDLNRRVDVAKEYAPRVDRAAKLSIQPQMGDTTTLRPDLDYTVRPKAWAGGFGVAPIRAAQMSAGTYNAQYPFYLKAGGGYPGQSLLDLYATSTRPGASGFGFYANHRGQFADIKNYDDYKNRAKETWNSAGVFGKAAFGRMSVTGEIGWDYDVVSLYGSRGEFNIPGAVAYEPHSPMQHYSTPRASLRFGHDFADLSYFNFRLGADGYMLSDRYDHKEHGADLFLELGKRFNVHNVTLKAGFETWKGGGKNKDAKSSILSLSPTYKYSDGNFIFRMGLTFAYEMPGEYNFSIMDMEHATGTSISGESDDKILWYSPYPSGYGWSSPDKIPGKKMWFLPQLELSFKLAGGAFNPYARLDSRIAPNSYRSLAAQNPYVLREMELVSSPASEVTYRMRGGFSGAIGGVFSYNVYAGYNIDKNIATFHYADLAGFMFDIYDQVKYMSFGAELEARIGGSFTVALDGRYDNYKEKDTYFHNCLPQYEAGLALKYTYRDKFTVKAGARLRDGIDFYDIIDLPSLEMIKSGTAVDISLAADYNISDKLGVFIEGSNLANQKLYPFPFYRGVGINVSAGIKLRF